MYGNVIEKLQIADRGGNLKEVTDHPVPGTTEITGEVMLEASGLASLAVSGNTITLSASPATAVPDPTLQAYYEELLASTDGLPYLATISKVPAGATGQLFLSSSECAQAGLFALPPTALRYPVDPDNALTITDLCPPCEDCQDYKDIYDRLSVISEWIEENHRANFVCQVGDTDCADASPRELSPITRLFRQYQATLFYWNYLVHAQSYVLLARAEDTNVHIWFGYYNSNCEVEDPVFFLALDMTQFQSLDCVTSAFRILNTDKKAGGATPFDVDTEISVPGSVAPTILPPSPTGSGTGDLTVSDTGAVGQWEYYDADLAAWQGPYASGATASGLTSGTYAIRFVAVIGYNTPFQRWVSITDGAETTVSATYTAETTGPGNGEKPWATLAIQIDGTMMRGDYLVVEAEMRINARPQATWDANSCDAEIGAEEYNRVVATGHWVGVFEGQDVSRLKEAFPLVAVPEDDGSSGA